MAQKLTDLELEILHSIPVSGASVPRAYAAWTDRDGEVQMGPVRWMTIQTRGDMAGVYYDCSPFPGAWSSVPEAQILRVRALSAMALQNAEGVR